MAKLPVSSPDSNKPPEHDAATAYAQAVNAGRVSACKWVQLACRRHLVDLEHGAERGLQWNPATVEKLTKFFQILKHSKGEWAGQPITLEPWQIFLFGSVFGWTHAKTGLRRFRTCYVSVGRKNGKSTLAAGLGLKLAFFDAEPGSEVYTAATKKDQALIVFSEARRMVLSAPLLRERIGVLYRNLHQERTHSKFEPLGQDADNFDGLNIHGAIVDELHAHKTRTMWDVLETATGARRQPLIFAITTAGSRLDSVCYEQHLYAQKVLEGVMPDDAYFALVYTMDDGEDWRTESAWHKANPNLGVSVKLDDLRMLQKRAEEMPSAKVSFLTKRLNVWHSGDVEGISLEQWRRAEAPAALETLAHVPCWIGMDLASRQDLAAVVALFQRDDGAFYLYPRFYLPADMVRDGALGRTAHLQGWADAGWLTLTEGDLIDFSVIREQIKTLAKQVNIQDVAYDPFQATHIVNELRESGLTLVEVPQTPKHLSGPFKAVRDLLKAQRLTHDGNPVMTWNVSNVTCKEDDRENIVPRKASRGQKIDGFTALLNALGRALLEEPVSSIYEDRLRRGERVLSSL